VRNPIPRTAPQAASLRAAQLFAIRVKGIGDVDFNAAKQVAGAIALLTREAIR
jgi:hypothetical protein